MKRCISVLLALTVALALTVTAFAESTPSNSTPAPYYSNVDQGIKVAGPLLSYTPLNNPSWGGSVDAVLAWHHPIWPMIEPAWISNTADIQKGISGDSWRWFTETVFLCEGATNISGTVEANADNAEEAYVNQILIGSDGDIKGIPFKDGLEWQTNKKYSFGPVQGPIQNGYLPIDFIVRNGLTVGGQGSNPTGLIFGATINYNCPGKQEMQHIWDVSAGDLAVYGPLSEYAPPHDSRWNTSTAVGAKLAIKQFTGWPSLGTPSNADWISNTYLVDPVNLSSWRRFSKTVDLNLPSGATNVSGTITVSADNAEEVYVNGISIGADGDLVGTPFNDHQEWSRFRVYNYNVPALPSNRPGCQYSVTFDFIMRNGSVSSAITDPRKNPTGLIYDATIENAQSGCFTGITLHLRKEVINDNGGTATPADFTLKAEGTLAQNSTSGPSPVDYYGKPDTFTLSESGPTGYTASAWSCDGGTLNGNSITITQEDKEVTCTITNDDIPIPNQATLIVKKIVINEHGGTLAAKDFSFKVNGGDAIQFEADGQNELKVDPGTYSVTELAVPRYITSYDNCTNLVVPAGGTATCTITNHDGDFPPPHTGTLIVKKIVINDNGGTKAAGDFAFQVNGSSAIPFEADGQNELGVEAGTYTVTELAVPGYTTTYDNCSNLVVPAGGTATCTITNDDDPRFATLIVKKVVINDNGGSLAAKDFSFKVNGSDAIPFEAGGQNDLKVDPGTYSVTEVAVSGYTTTYDNCSNLVIPIGGLATCTITNNDQIAHLKLVKTVINDNGGKAVATDFTLSAAGPTPISGAGGVESDVNAGSYTLSETSLPGYAAGAWSCVGGTLAGSSITLNPGQSAICTITNDDIAPKLHLRKIVVNDNGGTATPADFILTANGTGSNDLSGASPVDSGTGLLPDTWALSESSLYGYTASAWSCVGGSQNGSSITLGLGQEATCTITNNDQPGTIIVQKMTDPANTGSFAFDTTGAGYTPFSLTGGTQNSQTLNAGSYTVQELVPLTWELIQNDCTITGSGGSTGVGDLKTHTAAIDLKNGDTVTCVFHNASNAGNGNATRTQGFWSTHPQLANTVWFGGSTLGHTLPGVDRVVGIGDKMLCGRPVDTLGKLMGGFLSNIAKTSTGVDRSALDQARMQLLQQLLAAELNAAAFGTTPVNGSFAAWESAYCGTDRGQILSALQQADAFNNSGDSVAFNPGSPADRKTASSIALLTWWDILP